MGKSTTVEFIQCINLPPHFVQPCTYSASTVCVRLLSSFPPLDSWHPPLMVCQKGVSLKPGRCWNTPALYPEARPVTEHVHDSKLQWIDEVFTGHQTLNHHGGSRIYRSIPPQLDFILGAFGLIINSAIMHPPSPDLNKPHTTRGRSLYS